jgi:phosphonate transport system ATP-binding protein
MRAEQPRHQEKASAPSPSVHGGAPLGGQGLAGRDAELAIETQGLYKRYGNGAPVLADVDLAIRAGERVALIGANGCGKTTLLKCLIGLIPASEGLITVFGERFQRAPAPAQRRRLRRQIGFVFQHHGLVRRLSVLSNVVHGMVGMPGAWRACVHTLAPSVWREAAMDALAAVNLDHKALDRAGSLSGGQQQRVAIARALVRRPRLIIADEPAASLDPAAGHDVMALFNDLVRDHGITLLFTCHDMEHARLFSDRILALKAGGILFDMPSRNVTDAMLSEVFNGQVFNGQVFNGEIVNGNASGA